MVTDQEKRDYNEVVKARCHMIAEKLLDSKGMMAIHYYDEKMYCRETKACQKLTNQAFICKLWMIEVMMGKDPSKSKHPYAVMHIPLCDKHIQERVAFAKIEQKKEVF